MGDVLKETRTHYRDDNIFFCRPPAHVSAPIDWKIVGGDDSKSRENGLFLEPKDCVFVSIQDDGSVCLQKIRQQDEASTQLDAVLASKVEQYHLLDGLTVDKCAPVEAIRINDPEWKEVLLNHEQLGKESLEAVTLKDVKEWVRKEYSIPASLSFSMVMNDKIVEDESRTVFESLFRGGPFNSKTGVARVSMMPSIATLCKIRDEDTSMIDILVKTLTGKKIQLRVAALATVEQVKEQVYKQEQIPVDQQRMIFGGTQLNDNAYLPDYRIQNNSKLDLVLRLRGGMFHDTSSREGFMDFTSQIELIMPDGERGLLKINKEGTIEDLKKDVLARVEEHAKRHKRFKTSHFEEGDGDSKPAAREE